MKQSNRGKAIRTCVTYIVVGGMLCIFLFDIVTVLLGNAYEKRYPVLDETFVSRGEAAGGYEPQSGPPPVRIHFLNTDNSDCILLESQGHFALIDSGWGSGNPNEKSRRQGYEQRVVDYLKRVAGGADGNVSLDFVMPTHYHYDHAGGFARILADPAVHVDTVYLRPLDEESMLDYELQSWHIDETRRGIADAARARDFTVLEELPDEPFQLGAMTLRFFNLDSYQNPRLKGGNDNSIVTLITLGETKALLAGDVTNTNGLEKDLAPQLGQVDLLKLGHHGYSMSNSLSFLRAARPKLAIVTNGIGQVYPDVRWKLTLISRTPVYSTVHENGVIAALNDDGSIELTGNLHDKMEP